MQSTGRPKILEEGRNLPASGAIIVGEKETEVSGEGLQGLAFHPNYDDLAPLWADGTTVGWPGTAAAVEEAAVSTLTLTP